MLVRALDKQSGRRESVLQQPLCVPPNWAVYIAVDSADAAAEKVRKAGGTVVAPPFDVMDLGCMAVLQDPAGAVFCAWPAGSNTGTRIGGVMNTVGWIELTTNDEARAAKFYGDVSAGK